MNIFGEGFAARLEELGWENVQQVEKNSGRIVLVATHEQLETDAKFYNSPDSDCNVEVSVDGMVDYDRLVSIKSNLANVLLGENVDYKLIAKDANRLVLYGIVV